MKTKVEDKEVYVQWEVVTEKGDYTLTVGTFSSHDMAMEYAEHYEKTNKTPTFVIPVTRK